MIRPTIITVILAYAGITIACSSAGADTRGSAPADSVYVSTQALPAVRVADTGHRDSCHKALTIALTGDIMMGTTYPDSALPADNGKQLFKDVRSILRNADIAVGNLEGTLCDTGTTTKKGKAFNYAFRTPLRFAPRLSEAGYDFLSMANNHAFDFGLPAVRTTEQALRAEGILYAGLKGRNQCAILERQGLKIGFCAFGHNHYTMRHQDLQTVKSVLDSLCKCTDIIVVSFHGGAEGKDKSHLPQGKEMFLGEDRGSLRDFARFCVDHGADVIYGHGPHVVRCVEVYKGRFIAYSLGNFCTPYGINTLGVSGYAPVIEVKVNADGSFTGGQIYSFVQRRGQGPRIDKYNLAARQIRTLTAADIATPCITITNDGKITLK